MGVCVRLSLWGNNIEILVSDPMTVSLHGWDEKGRLAPNGEINLNFN